MTSATQIRIATLVAAAGLRGWLGLSRAARVSRSTIWDAIHGRKVPRRATVRRLAVALQISPELLTDILYGPRDEHADATHIPVTRAEIDKLFGEADS